METVRREEVNELKKLAYSAGQWTVQEPDKLGERLLDSLELELREFEGQIPEEFREAYSKKYIEMYASWMSEMSRCMSSFITGPANFPTAKAEKRNRWERSARERLDEWAKKVIKRLNGKHRLRGWEEIERLQEKADRLNSIQEKMKTINKIVRSKNSDEDKRDELRGLGISDSHIEILMEEPEYSFQRKGFQPWQMSNNLAKIKDTEERIRRLTKIAESNDREVEFEGGKIEICNSEERIRIYFDEIPSEEMRDKLKHAAFKWSRSNVAWQRQITDNAMRATERLFNVKIGG